MYIKPILKVLGLALLLGVCLSAQAVQAAPANEAMIAKAQKMIDDADQARKKAASINGEWRDTAKIIKKARMTLKKGDYVTAMKLAAQAHNQGVLGYQQAMSQQELKMPSYLKYE